MNNNGDKGDNFLFECGGGRRKKKCKPASIANWASQRGGEYDFDI